MEYSDLSDERVEKEYIEVVHNLVFPEGNSGGCAAVSDDNVRYRLYGELFQRTAI
jgi:hypothetical protein